jgi:hypothetical protein
MGLSCLHQEALGFIPRRLKVSVLLSALRTPSSSSLGTPRGCVGLQVAPGVINLILRGRVEYLSDKGCVIHPTLTAGGSACGEGECPTAVAFDHGALGAPFVDLPKLHVLNLVVSLNALDYLRHRPFPFPQVVGSRTRE